MPVLISKNCKNVTMILSHADKTQVLRHCLIKKERRRWGKLDELRQSRKKAIFAVYINSFKTHVSH